MAEKYDFYQMGQRYANEKMESLKKIAENIGKEYGKDARIEFEAGIVATIPVYGDMYFSEESDFGMSGTKDSGVPNMRNNSYFGGSGVSNQYIDGVYNDPDEPKKGGR